MSEAQNALRKVLVVEDSEAIRSSAESVLRQAGYDVFNVGKGADALEWIKANQPDAVLLDLSLPDLDGGKLCELVKSDSSLKGVYIFILLSSNEIKRIKELKALGADGFVIKPFVPKDLVEHMKSVLSKTKSETNTKTETSNQKKPVSPPKEPHSYEWFISEIKKETQEESPDVSSPDEPSPVERGSLDENEVECETKEMSSEQDEPSPVERGSLDENEVECETKEMSSEQDGYENFISQFKEEVQLSESHEPFVYGELEMDEETETTSKIKTLNEKPAVKSQNEKPTLDPERVTNELIYEVASKIAKEIVESMDKETLRSLIQKKIDEFKI